MKNLATTLGIALAPGVALAHPDHLADGGYGLAHLLTDPYHLALSVAAVAAFVVLRRAAARRRGAERVR